MKYLHHTIEYLFKYGKGKRFLTLYLLSLLPSAVFCYSYKLSDNIDFLFGFLDCNYPDFGSLWLSLYNHDAFSLIGLAISFVLFVLFTAYMTTIITRNIRVGEFALTKIFNSVNENFFPSIVLIGFYLISIFVAKTLFVLLAFLFLQMRSRVFGLVLTVLFFLVIYIVTVYIWSTLTLWLPTMSFSGQYVTKAFVSAFYKSRNYQRHFFVPTLLLFGVLLATSFATRFISVWYVKWIIDSLCFALTFTFFIAFMEITYCETESITREDMAKRYFWR